MKQTKRKITKVLGLDYFDFSFILNLNTEEAQNYNNFQDVNSTKDLLFMAKENSLLDKITISTTSPLINMLLFLNKSSKAKTFIELFSFNSFFLNEDEGFFKEIVNYVLEHNFIFNTSKEISKQIKNTRFSIKVNCVTVKDLFFGMDRQEDGKENNQEKEEKPKRDNPNDFTSLLECDFSHDYVILDVNKILTQTDEHALNVSLDEVLSLVSFIKTNHKNIKIISLFPCTLKNISVITYNVLLNLNALLANTDISLLEKKEAIPLFNLINSLNKSSFKEEKGKINDQQLEKLFLGCFDDDKSINFTGKTVILLDDFSK